MLLTAVEIPGIYVQPDTRLVAVFDNVEARLTRSSPGEATFECRNPTHADAAIRVFAEDSAGAARVLGPAGGLAWPVHVVPAGQTRVVRVTSASPR